MLIPNLDDTPVSTGKLPAGDYPVRIVGIEEGTASTGTPQITVELEVIDGAEKGQHTWDYLYVTSAALPILKGKLLACGYQIPRGQFNLKPEDLRGREFMAIVRIETYQGEERSKVKVWKRLNGSTPSMSSSPAAARGQVVDDDDIPFKWRDRFSPLDV